MCTLVVATRCWTDTPLLVAANRDERTGRPAAPPRVHRPEGRPCFVAPVDLVAGGTWLGLNDSGVCVGLTNRFGGAADPTRASRGALVVEALAHRTADAAARAIAASSPEATNPFHLVAADRHGAWLVRPSGGRLMLEPLAAGVHIITERSFGASATAREPRLSARTSLWHATAAPSDGELESLLAAHAEPSFEGVCVHVPEMGYATRSSTILRLGRGPAPPRWRYADGPPCTAPWADIDAVAALGRPE